MSNYSKATNFTSKDSLPTGNANKIVKGSEIDNELIAVSSAIASKADINSPAFTGTPAAPTAGSGTNTTQLATTAFVKNAFDALGTMSTQNKTAVDITGGTIVGVSISSLAADLAVADGGTGSSTFTANSVVLGNGTSALNANMVAPGTSGNGLVSNGTTWASQSIVNSVNGQTGAVVTTNLESIGSLIAAVHAVSVPFSNSNVTTLNCGDTVAGSALRRNYTISRAGGAFTDTAQTDTLSYGTIAYNQGGTALSGTYRCVGRGAGYESFDNGLSGASAIWIPGLFVKVS
jgi:hypothetical protein